MCGDSIRVVHPLFQEEDDGSIPISPLQLEVGQVDRKTFIHLNELWHSRLPKTTNCFEGICFAAHYKNIYYATAWWSKPIAQNRLKDGMITYELRRMAICDEAPKNTASRFMKIMVSMLKKNMPHIKKLISYQDAEVHTGTIYKASGWVEETCNTKHISWENRKDFNRVDQSKSPKIRWGKKL